MDTDFARFAAAYLASPGGAEAPLRNAIATSVLSPADQQTAQQIVTSIVPEPAMLGFLAIGTRSIGIRRAGVYQTARRNKFQGGGTISECRRSCYKDSPNASAH